MEHIDDQTYSQTQETTTVSYTQYICTNHVTSLLIKLTRCNRMITTSKLMRHNRPTIIQRWRSLARGQRVIIKQQPHQLAIQTTSVRVGRFRENSKWKWNVPGEITHNSIRGISIRMRYMTWTVSNYNSQLVQLVHFIFGLLQEIQVSASSASKNLIPITRLQIPGIQECVPLVEYRSENRYFNVIYFVFVNLD